MVFGKHYNGYSSTIRSGIYNEVAVGAFPAFLTMLPTDMVSSWINNTNFTIECPNHEH